MRNKDIEYYCRWVLLVMVGGMYMGDCHAGRIEGGNG